MNLETVYVYILNTDYMTIVQIKLRTYRFVTIYYTCIFYENCTDFIFIAI